MACSFCGGDKEIHHGSQDQYGEPVCVDCFEASYKPDPDISSDFEPKLYPRSRTAEFHEAQERFRSGG